MIPAVIDQIAQAAVEVKQRHMADETMDGNVMPTIHFYAGNDFRCMAMGVNMLPAEFIIGVGTTLIAAYDDIDSLVVVADAYMLKSGADVSQLERGELSKRWEAGDRNDITETFVYHLVTSSGEVRMFNQPYLAGDHEIVLSGPPEDVGGGDTATIGGMVPAAASIVFSSREKERPEMPDEVAQTLAESTDNTVADAKRLIHAAIALSTVSACPYPDAVINLMMPLEQEDDEDKLRRIVAFVGKSGITEALHRLWWERVREEWE